MSDLKINAFIKKLEFKMLNELNNNEVTSEYYQGVADSLKIAKEVRDSIVGEGHVEIKLTNA